MANTSNLPSSAVPPDLTAANPLLLELFDGRSNELSRPFAHWLMSSKTFAAFAQTYQYKIRKKIRTSQDIEETYNLYCELRTAYLLLQEPKFAVAYEPHGKEQGRSADFAVTFRTRTTFHIEVTRMRISQQEQQLERQEGAGDETGLEEPTDFMRHYESRRLADVVCDKFGQLSPDTPNILWVWGESKVLPELDVGNVMIDLKRRAEQRDANLFARYGFGKPADFIRAYQRLSAILVQSLHDQEPNRSPVCWLNNDARHRLPSKLAHLLRSLTTADTSPVFTVNQAEAV